MIIQSVRFVSSAMSTSVSVSAELVSKLDGRIRLDLQGVDDRLFFWVAASAIVVAIGCLMEGPEIFHDLWPDTFTCFAGRWVKKVGLVGWLLVVLGVAAEGVLEIYDHHASGLLQTFDEVLLTDAQHTAGNAQLSASAASDSARIAREQSDAATNSAASARATADGAIEKADSYAHEIGAAKQQSADASAKAADAVSRLADAENRLADATQKELAAEEALRNIKMPRSLIRTSELVDSLKPFKGTEYVFVSVFQDEESMYLLRAIDDVLQKAGWTRGKSVAGFPGINVYGTEERNFAVPIGFKIGIQISTDSTLPSQQLESSQMKDLPLYLQAAGTLKADLAQCISPLQDDSVGKLVTLETGTSTTIRIAVGRKP